MEKPWEALWRDKPPEPPASIAESAQLFVDDHLVESTHALVRRLNRPRKNPRPVLTPTLPWEGDALYCFGSVVRLPGTSRLRMYYRGMQHNPDRDRGEASSVLLFAESDDGIHWEKPLSPQRPYGRFESTNAVGWVGHDNASVIVDDLDPDPARRFKLVCSPWDWWPGLVTGVSAQGLTWQQAPGRIARLGDRMSFFYNPVSKRYVAWSRCYPIRGDRVVFACESADFVTWDPLPRQVLAADGQDPPNTQFYSAVGFPYESQFLGYLEVYRTKLAKLNTQLISSRDGKAWQRENFREPFLDTGEHGEHDGYWIFPTDNAPLRIGAGSDQLMIHYSARPTPHAPFRSPPGGIQGTIHAATLRVDGFVSMDAAGQQAALVTKPITFTGQGGLTVNARPFHDGADEPMMLKAHVLDERGQPIAHFTADDAIAVHGDDLAHALRWKDRGDLAELRGRPVRLVFQLFNTRLYSFRIR